MFNQSLVCALPSPGSAGLPGPAGLPLFVWFIGTMTQSDSSVPFAPVLRHSAFSGRSAPLPRADSSEVSRFSCMKFPSVPGVFDYAGLTSHSRLRTPWYCLPLHPTGSAPRFCVFAALYPAHQCLCLCFVPRLTTSHAKLEVRMVRYSFPVRLFHSRLHAGLSRRSDAILIYE